ncbi:MAG: hypothetical protein ACM3QU_13080 [Verrucomicrobiota bacterium]
MSTTEKPAESPSAGGGEGGGYRFQPVAGARMPIPGNAELALFLFVWIVVAIIWAASDAVDASGFVTATVVLTFGYLLSRGIAKASRVLEQ